MDNYFDAFKENKNNRFRIPKKLVDDYKDDIFFMVDSDEIYIQVVRPRIVWLKHLDYEVNIDETKDIIEALINELVDPKSTYFGTYDEAKARIELEIKLPQAINKGKRRIAKLKTSTPLLLTEGKGEDEEEEDEEKFEDEEPLKKKGKVIITKPAKNIVFTRRASRKKANKEGGDIIFRKPPPTFQERLKELESGARIKKLQSIKI